MNPLPIAPYTGFGDEPNYAIKFGLRRVNGRLPDWNSPVRKTTHEIVNSSETVHQYGGRDDWAIRLPIWLASLDDLELLDAQVGRQSTLRYLWGLTKRAGGVKQTIGPYDYLILPDTSLDALVVDESTVRSDGRRDAVATFTRAYTVNTYLGYAPLAPEVP